MKLLMDVNFKNINLTGWSNNSPKAATVSPVNSPMFFGENKPKGQVTLSPQNIHREA